jgi:hypothetical protein
MHLAQITSASKLSSTFYIFNRFEVKPQSVTHYLFATTVYLANLPSFKCAIHLFLLVFVKMFSNLLKSEIFKYKKHKQMSRLVVRKLDSRLEGCWLEFHPILNGNSVRAQLRFNGGTKNVANTFAGQIG